MEFVDIVVFGVHTACATVGTVLSSFKSLLFRDDDDVTEHKVSMPTRRRPVRKMVTPPVTPVVRAVTNDTPALAIAPTPPVGDVFIDTIELDDGDSEHEAVRRFVRLRDKLSRAAAARVDDDDDDLDLSLKKKKKKRIIGSKLPNPQLTVHTNMYRTVSVPDMMTTTTAPTTPLRSNNSFCYANSEFSDDKDESRWAVDSIRNDANVRRSFSWRDLALQLFDAVEDFEDLHLPSPVTDRALTDREYRVASRKLAREISDSCEKFMASLRSRKSELQDQNVRDGDDGGARHVQSMYQWKDVALRLHKGLQELKAIDSRSEDDADCRNRIQCLQYELRRSTSNSILTLLCDNTRDREFTEQRKLVRRTMSSEDLLRVGCYMPFNDEWASSSDDDGGGGGGDTCPGTASGSVDEGITDQELYARSFGVLGSVGDGVKDKGSQCSSCSTDSGDKWDTYAYHKGVDMNSYYVKPQIMAGEE